MPTLLQEYNSDNIPTKTKKSIERATKKKYGRLLAIKFSHCLLTEKNRKHYIVEFLCDCGNSKFCTVGDVIGGKISSCGCLRIESVAKLGRNNLDKRTKYGAREANAREVYKSNYGDGDLTFEDFIRLTSMVCDYCGCAPGNKSHIRRKHIPDSAFIYQGLDRVNNDQPHNLSNLVPSCWYCNQAKSNRSVEEFEDWVRAIHSYRNL